MTGVVVHGVHRSGTSAVAGLLVAAGLPAGAPEELMPANAANPAGYFERLSLVELDDALLAEVGATWDAPPTREQVLSLGRRQEPAAWLAGLGPGPVVLKDPRMGVLLPVWRPAVEELQHVLVVRDPLAVAQSLARRDRMPLEAGLALWECCLTALLAGLEGLVVRPVRYESLLEGPEAAVALVGDLGLSLSAGSNLDGQLQHERPAGALRDAVLSPQQRRLWEHVEALTQTSQQLTSPPALWEPTAASQDLLRARAREQSRRASRRQPVPLPAPPVMFPRVVRPRVSVLVIGWRDAPLLLTCLRSLSAAVGSVPVEVVLVLNEATASLTAEVAAQVSGVATVTTRVNVGFGAAMNLAAAQARGEHLLLLNDDTELHEGWLEALLEVMDAHPLCGAVGSRLLNPDGGLQEAGAVLWSDGSTTTVDEGSWGWARQVDYCSACSLLVRRSTWERLGGFDEEYYPAYYEDVDLCLRIREAGEQVWFQPASRVTHRRSSSTGAGFRHFVSDRNRARLRERWALELTHRGQLGAQPLREAAWWAMGSPERVLALSATREQLVELCSSGRYHVAALGEAGVLGVEEVVDPLEQHLAEPGVAYEHVVVSDPSQVERVHALLPDARVLVAPSGTLGLTRALTWEEGRPYDL